MQPGHHISPEFILSGSGSSNIPLTLTSKIEMPPQPILPSSSPPPASFRFEPFKLSTQSSPYIPTFMNSSSFYSASMESKPPGLAPPDQLNITSDNLIPTSTLPLLSNTEKAKQKVELITDMPDAPSQPKSQITILKRLTSTSTNEDTVSNVSKPIPAKSSPAQPSGTDQDSCQVKTTTPTKILQHKSSLEPLSITKSSTTESLFVPKSSIEPTLSISKPELESEIVKAICFSIEKSLFPRIEASIKSLVDDIANFQIDCTRKCMCLIFLST